MKDNNNLMELLKSLKVKYTSLIKWISRQMQDVKGGRGSGMCCDCMEVERIAANNQGF